MASGGSSLSLWRFVAYLRNYFFKSYASLSKEVIENDINKILRLTAKNSPEEPKSYIGKEEKSSHSQNKENIAIENPITPPENSDAKVSYGELWKALQIVNTYLPQLPSFGNKEVTTTESRQESVPKWLLQKRDSISKSSVDARTRHLVTGLGPGLSDITCLRRIEDLISHLKSYPFTKGSAIKCFGISRLLKVLNSTKDPHLQAASRESLALLGYHKPVGANGIRILSIDGGGVRGLVALEVLRHLELKTSKPTHELFDFICGVSTGAILAVLIGAHKLPLDECDTLYRKISNKVFSQTTIKGTASLVWKNSFYDSDAWTDILKQNMGDIPMMESTRDPDCTKICLVSTQANANWIKAFLFRNYIFPYRVASHFNGSCTSRLWEGVRASAAAPGYFSEFVIDDLVLLDGGVLVNNPTAIAIHEARQLWPDTPLQSVVSIGTGKHEPVAVVLDKTVSWAMRFRTILNSATDTEGVHTVLHDLLPSNVYFRLNPYLSEEILLDELKEEKLTTMIEDAALYLRKNESRLDEAAVSLMTPKTLWGKFKDEYNLKRNLWNI